MNTKCNDFSVCNEFLPILSVGKALGLFLPSFVDFYAENFIFGAVLLNRSVYFIIRRVSQPAETLLAGFDAYLVPLFKTARWVENCHFTRFRSDFI